MKLLYSAIILPLLFAGFSIHAQSIQASQDSVLAKWKFMMGKWVSELNDESGQQSTIFTFDADLNGEILTRRTTKDINTDTSFKLPTRRDNLLIIYGASGGNFTKAIYFGDHGRVINYSVSFPTDSSITLTSGSSKDKTRRYRETYIRVNRDMIRIKSEASPANKPTAFGFVSEANWVRVK